MNSQRYENEFRRCGFFWNQALESFVTEYAGKTISYPHHKSKEMKVAHLFPSDLFLVRRDCGQYDHIVRFLNSEIAPVGDCNNGYVQLLLTENGELVGFADYLMLRWGRKELPWRLSLGLLLKGNEASRIGVIE